MTAWRLRTMKAARADSRLAAELAFQGATRGGILAGPPRSSASCLCRCLGTTRAAVAASAFMPPAALPEADPFLAGSDSVAVPIRVIDDHIYLQAAINGGAPQTFMFDTGAIAILDTSPSSMCTTAPACACAPTPMAARWSATSCRAALPIMRASKKAIVCSA